MASVALGHIHLRFAWQAWYKLDLVARLVAVGRRGAAALCVAGVAPGDIHLGFTRQAWNLATSTFVLRGRRGTSCTWCHTPSLTHHLSHHFVAHHLSHAVTDNLLHTIFHTALSHTIFHTPLCHTPSFTHHL